MSTCVTPSSLSLHRLPHTHTRTRRQQPGCATASKRGGKALATSRGPPAEVDSARLSVAHGPDCRVGPACGANDAAVVRRAWRCRPWQPGSAALLLRIVLGCIVLLAPTGGVPEDQEQVGSPERVCVTP